MKKLIWILLSILLSEASAQSLNRHELRMWYLAAADRKTALDSFTAIIQNIPSKTPIEESYCGMCCAMHIAQTEGYWAKIKMVYDAKKYFNHAIERDPDDTELHFLRFLLEHFLPSFLGLNKHITEDLKIVFAHPDFADDDPLLKKQAMEFLRWTRRCSLEQTAILDQQLNAIKKKE